MIELLVVIAIIGMLSSVVLASLNSARMKSRDARRIADLAQIRNALELYFDTNGYYPQSDCGWDCNGYRYSYASGSWSALAADLAPYISSLPVDPKNSPAAPPWGGGYTYTYGNVGRSAAGVNPGDIQYDLTALLENPNDPNRSAVKDWKFYFNDGASWNSYSGQIYEASLN